MQAAVLDLNLSDPGSALGRNDSLSRRRQADDRAQIR